MADAESAPLGIHLPQCASEVHATFSHVANLVNGSIEQGGLDVRWRDSQEPSRLGNRHHPATKIECCHAITPLPRERPDATSLNP